MHLTASSFTRHRVAEAATADTCPLMDITAAVELLVY
jgi:hypothetical protein